MKQSGFMLHFLSEKSIHLLMHFRVQILLAFLTDFSQVMLGLSETNLCCWWSRLLSSLRTTPASCTTTASNEFCCCLCNLGGSVAEWLACWTQAQKGLGSNRSHDAVR